MYVCVHAYTYSTCIMATFVMSLCTEIFEAEEKRLTKKKNMKGNPDLIESSPQGTVTQ